MYNKVLNLIKSKKSKIGIFGLGYVGLPLALRFAKKKFNVFGYDKNLQKISSLKLGKSYINQIPNSVIKKFVNKNFKVFYKWKTRINF